MCTRADRKECAHSKKKKQKNVKLEINSFRNVLVLEERESQSAFTYGSKTNGLNWNASVVGFSSVCGVIRARAPLRTSTAEHEHR
jgi:hypothetical protein